MRLYLQLGYGMMDHCQHLIERWERGTVILSPRDLEPEQLVAFSERIRGLPRGRVLFDPQFYSPHSDHERLCSHSYWPSDYSTGSFWSGPQLTELVRKIFQCNATYGCKEVILPGMLASEIDDDWLATQQAVLEVAAEIDSDIPVISTVALSGDAAKSEEQIALLLEHAEDWNPTGYYIVCEHPENEYLVSDAQWLTNILNLIAGLRLRGAKVLLGYANQQMLVAAAAKATAICSGSWLNVRAFSLDKFSESEGIKRKSTWYYCPQAFSEYKIPALDIANARGQLQRMAPPTRYDGQYASPLFSGAQPSSVGWPEPQSFRHYLFAIRAQAVHIEAESFNETVNAYNRMLDTANNLLTRLRNNGVDGEVRDFAQLLEVNRDALAALVASQGPMLRRRWDRL
jgi:hypothetical protein